ncbi:hypothetical protein E5329_03175 [Petralouisia muris]|uniref:Uncharacterized protein n=1 Tax=Petralouisia muris TaxID=3032872 RepID=A0AC61S1U1_9FIRM|nr:hypothetical protein [Petralouisia muris]TGY97864.1 hypothetical protein E5329_03175 [Petralouisia muris]
MGKKKTTGITEVCKRDSVTMRKGKGMDGETMRSMERVRNTLDMKDMKRAVSMEGIDLGRDRETIMTS